MKLTPAQIKQIVDLGTSGTPASHIATRVGVPCNNVNSILYTRSITPRNLTATELSNHRRTYYVNDHLLDHPSPEASYFLGFFTGDGYLRKNTVSFKLAPVDAGHLYMVQRLVNTNSPIRYYRRHNYVSLSFTSARMSHQLQELGFDNQKTFTGHIPPGYENDTDYLRGLYDADGWITHSHHQGKLRLAFGLCGNTSIVTTAYQFFSRSLPRLRAKPFVYKKKRDHAAFIISGPNLALEALHLLYHGKQKISLRRKYNHYHHITTLTTNPTPG